jgi:hypothetical protein
MIPRRLIALGLTALSLSVALSLAEPAAPAPSPAPPELLVPPLPPQTLPGKTLDLSDGDVKATLFIPNHLNSPERLTIHFHLAVEFAIDAHLRRGLDGPLLVFNLGSGSTRYQKPFEDSDRLQRFIMMVQTKTASPVEKLDITSFSAGYGAVREILKQERYVKRIGRLMLCDSLYASWSKTAPTSQPSEQQMQPFVDFAKRAVAGRAEFLLSSSQVVPPDYASTEACVKYVVEQAGGKVSWLNPQPPLAAPPYLLRGTADQGGLHAWFYSGDAAQAHVVHVKNLDAFWKAMDAGKK